MEPMICGVCESLVGASKRAPIWQDDLWHVRHADAPYGAAGWLMLISKRHVAGPAHFDDAEAASFGPTLRRVSKTLEEVTGALRIYVAAMGESHPHFHMHLVPRRAQMPNDAKAWSVFDLQRAAQAGEVRVAERDVASIVEALTVALATPVDR